MASVHTRILPPESVSATQLTYVVIAAWESGRWVFVRHRDRTTWEMPTGHIEKNESADQAAVRELYEETGTLQSAMHHLCDYEVTVDHHTEFGRLYTAEIQSREDALEYEIAEIGLGSELPEALTYPEVQTLLFDWAERHFKPAAQS